MVTTLTRALCTTCTQGEVRISMRGIITGVWSKVTVTKNRRTEQCERCEKKPAKFIVTARD